MVDLRRIDRVIQARPTLEGAGVKLKRAFGPQEVPLFDPFLLLDDFHSTNPEDYLPGFPWHPHRGIETVTYVLEGSVEHGDSMSNKGVIGSGDIQWMTAGNGIIHQEMPKGSNRRMAGFQLWVNLPSTHKMTNPKYRGIKETEIPTINAEPGVTIKIIAGNVKGRIGPVQDLTVPCEYLDITMKPNTTHEQLLSQEFKAFAYIINGKGFSAQQETNPVKPEQTVLFSQGEKIKITTTDDPIRFLLISGKPIREPVAWLGPIVMNTQEELRTAFNELDKGTFLKTKTEKKSPELHPTYYKP